MMQRLVFYVMCVGLVILSPSCIKYYELSNDEWPQAEKTYDRREIAHNFIRTETVYEEFRTEAAFDVLWLSDQVRTAFVDRVVSSHGKSKQDRRALLGEELVKNRTSLSFIVLADVRARDHDNLSEKNSHWHMYLKTIDGQAIESDKVKEIEVDPAFRYFFGHRFMPVKTAYLVSFPLHSIDGVHFFSETEGERVSGDEVVGATGAVGVGRLEMVFSSPDLKRSVVWDPNDYKKAKELLPDEDFYWC